MSSCFLSIRYTQQQLLAKKLNDFFIKCDRAHFTEKPYKVYCCQLFLKPLYANVLKFIFKKSKFQFFPLTATFPNIPIQFNINVKELLL